MAHKESEELKTNERYSLAEYSFRLERSSIAGSSNDKLEAICTHNGKNARKSIQIASSAQVQGWYVEANDTTADVYAVVKSAGITSIDGYTVGADGKAGPCLVYQTGAGTVTSGRLTALLSSRFYVYYNGVLIHSSPFDPAPKWSPRTLYWTTSGGLVNLICIYATGDQTTFASGLNPDALGMDISREAQTMLVGRFPIELKDAGGTGPSSDWGDPGDWNEDPSTVLQVTVEGALSGRHNDPLNDTSYSYVPVDKATVKDYGCGGDGGHGGGGGGGASSIVVYKFATDKANWKEIVCKPKRHGYGSGGGKGGKGGDGCILVYY